MFAVIRFFGNKVMHVMPTENKLLTIIINIWWFVNLYFRRHSDFSCRMEMCVIMITYLIGTTTELFGDLLTHGVGTWGF